MENSGINSVRNGKEDRISTLTDELIHCILSSSGVKLNEVVRTCILSKRWVNLWRTFPKLNFASLRYKLGNDAKYIDFITKFFLGRAQQVEACSVYIDLTHGFDDSVRSEVLLTLHQAVSHCVRELHIFKAKLDSHLSFPVLRELTLYKCCVSFTKWSLPCLTTLDLYSSPHGKETMLSFKEFHCLKNLILGGYFYFMDPPEFVRIDPPNLENLDIVQGNAIPIPGCKFVVSAPRLKCFRFYGRYVPVVSADGGFPCLEQVWFSIYLGKEWSNIDMDFDDYHCWELDEIQTMLKISSLFREFRETKVLTIFSETFGVLSRVFNFFKYHPSPFVNLNSLYLRLREYVPQMPNVNNHVIKYLLSKSPGAEFIIQCFYRKPAQPQMSNADDNTSDDACSDTSD